MENNQDVSNVAGDPASSGPVKEDTVSYDTHRKLLSQLKSQKERETVRDEMIATLEAELATFKEDKMRADGEKDKLIGLKDEQLAKLKADLEAAIQEKQGVKNEIENTWKLNAFYQKLPGKLVNDKYLDFVDLESIHYDHETGTVDASSVDEAVNNFMKEHHRLVDVKKIGKLPAQPGVATDVSTAPTKLSDAEKTKLLQDSIAKGII